MNATTRYVIDIYQVSVIIRDTLEYLVPRKDGYKVEVYNQRKNIIKIALSKNHALDRFLTENKETGEKSWLATTLLAAILGPFGVHRFYTGYTIIGILQLLTLGGCGFWLLIDYIMLLANKYNDKDGLPLAGYNGITAFILLILSLFAAVILLGSD